MQTVVVNEQTGLRISKRVII